MAAQTSQGLLRALREDIQRLEAKLDRKADVERVQELERTIRGSNGTAGLAMEVQHLGDRIDHLSETTDLRLEATNKSLDKLASRMGIGISAFVLGVLAIIIERVLG